MKTVNVIRKPSSRPSPTIIENAVSRLRGAIMVGDLRPGQKLIEAELCEELKISRPSLRETLRALEAERLIELVPHRGPSVAKLGDREVTEIHDVWALLTGETVYRFADLATPKDIATLKSILVQLKRALATKNAIQQLNVTNSFFGHISEQCGNEVLINMITSLVSQINFLRAQSLISEGWRMLCALEIEAIYAAIQKRKPRLARQAARQHIESACAAARNAALMPAPDSAWSKGRKITRLVGMRRWVRPKPGRAKIAAYNLRKL